VYIPHNQNLDYEFGPYHLNLSSRRLTREGEKISLTPKAAEILMLLVTNAGQLVEKDFLLKEVWPDTFVEESNLAQNIFTLRKALGDERDGPKYIETVPRRGYRFIASVRISEVNDSDRDGAGSETEATDGRAEAVAQRTVIAVLPFVNATGNPDVEYLSEGITDNIINNLSRVSQLRVMSRSAVFRHRKDVFDPQVVGRELGAKAVLVGQISARPVGIAIGVELVEVARGWQLWGATYDCELKDILEIQDTITRQLLVNLKLKLTGEEEKRITVRYTENAEAYQAYLEGRYHWSLYTRSGIEKAIGHFRQAIELDPNYALAYAAIVDCYLRLATNYLPPEGDLPIEEIKRSDYSASLSEFGPKIKLRFEWDWKGAERELRRADELKTTYPAAHQWYAAYQYAVAIYKQFESTPAELDEHEKFYPKQLSFVTLSPNEEVQIVCTVTREQIEVGNYDAGCLMLRKWWTPGESPRLTGLHSYSAADLLFTTGSLAGCLSSTGHLLRGQKHAEALLCGAIGMFEHLGAKRRSAESRIELALSYYRQGMFELTKTTLLKTLEGLDASDINLRGLALLRLAVVERHAGHVQDSLKRLAEARELVELNGPLITGRYHHELASALKLSAIDENRSNYLAEVSFHFKRAVYEFVAIGHYRYVAVVENNHGFLLLNTGLFKDAEAHLRHARKLFDILNDKIRLAQVDETLAQLYTATTHFELAKQSVERAVTSLEESDEDALLAEALRTKAIVFCKLNRYQEARVILEGARRVAERCGDYEGAGLALLLMMENMRTQLEEREQKEVTARMSKLLKNSQLASVRMRLHQCLNFVKEDYA
jgi:DNA-binding winged helix-turn-helix (wHTH) protein/tetratricopeptide (TPR) repeat protein